MVEVTLPYQYTFLGDVDVTVDYTLTLECVVGGISLESVELKEVHFEGIRFDTRFAHRLKLKVEKSPEGLPEYARRKFETMFRQVHEDTPFIREHVAEKCIERAVGQYYELAHAG